ncbi:MAG: sulfite exporter TauE/SafE family protein [Clostridiales bacterium]|nr:sulfite exporter TauE/SafE family protein [Clostridiales bacterium]
MINILVGLLSGVISGLGIGGGVLLIPMLVFFSGVGQHEAQNINLLYFIPTAIISLITHNRNGDIEKKVIFKIVALGLLGAFCGSILANKLDKEVLRRFFGGFLLIMGFFEFKRRPVNEGGEKHIKA